MQRTGSLFLIISVIFAAGYTYADPADTAAGTPLNDAEKKAVIEQLNKMQKDISSISAKVSQVKKSRLIKKEIRMEGTVILKKPNLLRWETNRPEKAVAAVNGEKMTVYRPDVKEAQVYELSEDVIARNTANFFSASLQMSFDELEKRFSLTIFRNKKNIIIELKPKSKTIARYLETVRLWYDEKSGLPAEFEVIGPKGDKTHTWLRDITVNPKLGDDLFDIALPDDVWITNRPGPAVSN